MRVEARLRRAPSIGLLPIAGDGHEFEPREAIEGAQPSRELVAIHHRQANVEDREIRMERRGGLERTRAVARRLHDESQPAERLGQQHQGVAIVIDDEDAPAAPVRARLPLPAPLAGHQRPSHRMR